MPLQQTSGNVTSDAYGGGVAVEPVYIEQIFSTYLYTGTGASQTITNGIDLAGKGGLTWIKWRSGGGLGSADHCLFDTQRGVENVLFSNSTASQNPYGVATGSLTAFNSNGFSLGADALYGRVNYLNGLFASWTFRKQPKFFDVVTWTGDGTANRAIPHNLGSVPGMVFMKKTSGTGEWYAWSRAYSYAGGTAPSVNCMGTLNSTIAFNGGYSETQRFSPYPTTTEFYTGSVTTGTGVNNSGDTYVAYLFAHNAGGFGLTGTDNVISCGSYTGNGSTSGQLINLGYEPQWLLIKNASAANSWTLFDCMRGLTNGDLSYYLQPNTSNAENNIGSAIAPNASGFNVFQTTGGFNVNTNTYIYIAIRRGPMKVPTDGTSVYATDTLGGTSPNPPGFHSGFPVDLGFYKVTNSATNWTVGDRLRGTPYLNFNTTDAETDSSLAWDYQNGYLNSTSVVSTYRAWMMRRAPSFFDEVCYTGNGNQYQGINHNLGVKPQIVLTKSRNTGGGAQPDAWQLIYFDEATNYYSLLRLNTTSATINYATGTNLFRTDVFYAQKSGTGNFLSNADTNVSGTTYVAYLFATCAGVSKVGSYSGTGATQTIDCGFTGGARFVLVKRTDSTGDWYVWDTARGMVSGTDPSLLLNSTAAEVNANSIYTTTGGFQIVSTAAGINASGGTYIYLAIA